MSCTIAAHASKSRSRRGVSVGPARRRDLLDVYLQLVAKAPHAPAHADELPALEGARQGVGFAKGPGCDRAGPVAQLEREIRSPGAGGVALLARARKHAV